MQDFSNYSYTIQIDDLEETARKAIEGGYSVSVVINGEYYNIEKGDDHMNKKTTNKIKVGDIVLVGYNTDASSYYMGVVTDLNEEEEMACIKDLSQVEDNIQPLRCLTKATLGECVDELRSIYGYY